MTTIDKRCEHAFAFFLGGGERNQWRKLLSEHTSAQHVSINFRSLPSPKRAGTAALADLYPEHEVLVESGGLHAPKDIDHDAYAERYTAWVSENIDSMCMVTEYDPAAMPLDWVESWRERFWDTLPRDKFIPIWHQDQGLNYLDTLATHYPRIGLVRFRHDETLINRVRTIHNRHATKFHGVAFSGLAPLTTLPLASASATSWLSPTRFGDTQIWDGSQMHWYPVKSRVDARRRHWTDIEKAGFDPQKYADGDNFTVNCYSVWAWCQFELDVARKRQRLGHDAKILDMQRFLTRSGSHEDAPPVSNMEMDVSQRAPLIRRETKTLFPGIEIRTETPDTGSDQEGSGEPIQVPALAESGLRTCNSCYLSARCPAYTPGAECAFRMPVEIRTKEQLMSSLSSLLELQFSRIAFARASEEADGSIVEPSVSRELDRYMQMVSRLKEIQSDTSFLRVEIQAPSEPGIISRMLGASFGQAAREQTNYDPDASERVMRDFIDIPEEP